MVLDIYHKKHSIRGALYIAQQRRTQGFRKIENINRRPKLRGDRA